MPSFWTIQPRELRSIATIVAVVLWVLAAVFAFAGSGYRSIAGPLKGGDFIFFYTLGAAARTGDATLLYDPDRLHALQISLVPASAPDWYLPVYPPHVSLLYAPWTALPYGLAALVWAGVLIAGYAGIVYAVWRRYRGALPDGGLVAVMAAAFFPFWSLVVHGHNTIIPLAVFFVSWLALERRRPLAAGFVLGWLLLKPQFGIPLAVVVLCNREWAMLAGIAASALLQAAVVAVAYDAGAIVDYARFMQQVAAVEYLIEPKPFELHSIRAVTRLLPDWIGLPLWVAASAIVVAGMVRFWRRVEAASARMGVLVLASVLVSPHLFVYDATVLVLSFLWLGAWVARDPSGQRVAGQFRPLVLGLFAAFLLPIARVAFVQVSVLLLLWLHLKVVEAGLAAPAPAVPVGPAS